MLLPWLLLLLHVELRNPPHKGDFIIGYISAFTIQLSAVQLTVAQFPAIRLSAVQVPSCVNFALLQQGSLYCLHQSYNKDNKVHVDPRAPVTCSTA